MKRSLDIVVISDVHLGSYSSHASELLRYLKHIQPEILVINGDFIDMWRFRKKYFPTVHIQVFQQVLKMAQKGTKVYYIIGNHDEHFRQYADYSRGNIHFRRKLVLQLKDKRVGIFHGDDFDLSVQYSKAVTTLGGKGYASMLFLNRLINNIRRFLALPPRSFAQSIKAKVDRAVHYMNSFEELALKVAAKENYDYVICGHIHHPRIRIEKMNDKKITYLNAGDWVENLTALEYRWGKWQLYEYNEMDYGITNKRLKVKSARINTINRDKSATVSSKHPEELFRQLDLL